MRDEDPGTGGAGPLSPAELMDMAEEIEIHYDTLRAAGGDGPGGAGFDRAADALAAAILLIRDLRDRAMA